MGRLRDVLNGTWVGSYGYEGRYQTNRTNTQFELSGQINPATRNLQIIGKGNDLYGNFTFEGAATSSTEIAMTKLIGAANNWWHKATVDLDKREMRGNWGPAWYPNAVHGSLAFQRHITPEELQREAEAAGRAAEEARKKQEEAERRSSSSRRRQAEARGRGSSSKAER